MEVTIFFSTMDILIIVYNSYCGNCDSPETSAAKTEVQYPAATDGRNTEKRTDVLAKLSCFVWGYVLLRGYFQMLIGN